jgi:molybdopterin synthase catalytic subunit
VGGSGVPSYSAATQMDAATCVYISCCQSHVSHQSLASDDSGNLASKSLSLRLTMAGGEASVAQRSQASTLLDPASFPQHLSTDRVYIELRYTPLDIPACLAFTRSPSAGANVLFLGTTRNNFDDRPVSRLSYSAYPALALKSLCAIAEDVREKHGLEKVYIAHRLGEVVVEEESIAVSVSSGHRGAAWKGAEELLERVKQRAEIWKREWFADTGEVEEGVWRANKDRDAAGRRMGDDGADSAASSREGVAASAEPALESSGDQAIDENTRDEDQPKILASHQHQTRDELDSDVADYIAALTAKLKM